MKRHPITSGAVVLATLLLGAARLWADSTVDVRCVDPSGGAVANAAVRLQHLNTGKTRDKKSDGKGTANFNKLEDGVYRVVGQKEGFEPALFEFVSLKGSAQQAVTLQFKAGDPQKQLYFQNQALGQKAGELSSQALQALQGNKFAEAEKLLLESLEINPSNPQAQYFLSIAQVQQNKWEPAQASLKRADELATVFLELPQQGGGPNPYQELKQQIEVVSSKMGAMKIRTQGDQFLKEKKFEEAAAKYREALAAEKDPDIMYNLAVALAQTKKYDEATTVLDQAIQLKPGEQAYQSLKKQIIDFKANEVLIGAQGVLDQGNELFNKQDYAGALKKYEQVLGSVPEKSQGSVWFQIARAQGQLKQPDKAIEAYKKAMALAPEKPDYKKALAQYYLDQKRYEDALNLYAEQGGGGAETPDQAIFALGQKLSSQGNAEVAQVAFEKVLTLNPQHAEATYELGMALYYGKKADKRAFDLLTKYVEIGKQKDHVDNAKTVLVVLKRRMSGPTKK